MSEQDKSTGKERTYNYKKRLNTL